MHCTYGHSLSDFQLKYLPPARPLPLCLSELPGFLWCCFWDAFSPHSTAVVLYFQFDLCSLCLDVGHEHPLQPGAEHSIIWLKEEGLSSPSSKYPFGTEQQVETFAPTDACTFSSIIQLGPICRVLFLSFFFFFSFPLALFHPKCRQRSGTSRPGLAEPGLPPGPGEIPSWSIIPCCPARRAAPDVYADGAGWLQRHSVPWGFPGGSCGVFPYLFIFAFIIIFFPLLIPCPLCVSPSCLCGWGCAAPHVCRDSPAP